MGKNYKETRERLRKLLHKKKTKRRPPQNPVVDNKGGKPAGPTTTAPAPLASKGAIPKNPIEKPNDTPKLKESPSIKDLLEFIEGNDVVCKNEKKAAKKARQFEKKQMILLQKQREEEERIRQVEEERLRKEREAEMLENLRKATNAKKKRNKKRKQQLLQEQQQQQQHQQQRSNQGTRQQQQPKKPEFSPPHIPGASNPGSQMVTIKRVMEPHDSEPTVTITLRGATPKQDKVLYTLFNGKVCESSKNAKGPIPKHLKDIKLLKQTEKIAAPPKKIIPPKPQPAPALPLHTLDKKIVRDHLSYQIPTVPPTPRSTKELTNPTSIQISNAVTSMTRNGFHDFNFEGIKLPPGITITKVDPFNTKIKMASRPDEDTRNQVSLKPIPKPPKKAQTPEVIIVSTNKLKEESDAKLLNARQGEAGKAQSISNSSKRRRRKKEAAAAAAAAAADQNAAKLPSSYPGLDIEVIKSADETTSDLCDQMSVLTINPYADKEGDPEQPSKSKKKRKKRKKAKTEGGADSEDWNTLDNVFAPKDLDFEDGDLDDAERELEAFKLFCMQSVPLKRKEKVNLNLKDLVLKKKSVSCS